MSLPLQPIPVGDLKHAHARWLHAYWKSKTAGEALPRFEAIALGEMRSVASDLMALEPTATTGELRYRLVGAAITTRFGADLAGKTLRLDAGGGWAAAFRQAMATRHAVALRGRVSGWPSGGASFESVVLPLACTDEGSISILAGMFFFDDWSAATDRP
jgi:hypothetical protein